MKQLDMFDQPDNYNGFTLEQLKKGVFCGHCSTKHQARNRSIYRAIARILVALYRLDAADPGKDWHISQLGKIEGAIGGDFAKLRYWDLIEPGRKNDDPTKNRSGYWKITGPGRQFVRGRLVVTKNAIVYNGECIAFEGPTISIKDAMGENFDIRNI